MGQHGKNQSNHGWRKITTESYPSEEETNSGSDDNPNESEGKVITVGQSDTQDGTSGSSDSDTLNDSVKGPKGWEPILQQNFVKESWEDDSILEEE